MVNLVIVVDHKVVLVKLIQLPMELHLFIMLVEEVVEFNEHLIQLLLLEDKVGVVEEVLKLILLVLLSQVLLLEKEQMELQIEAAEVAVVGSLVLRVVVPLDQVVKVLLL
jgi:hypothetical protein